MTQVCISCNKEVETPLFCPICKNENRKSPFCTQECYKSVWNVHKLTHFHNNPFLKCFDNYKFSGSLRPYPRKPRISVPESINKPDYSDTGIPVSEKVSKRSHTIISYTQEQIESIREACLLGRRALDYAHSLLRVGITTEEIDDKVHKFIIENSGYPSPLNYYGYPKSICTSINEVICHGIPDSRPLQNGDIINIDITVYYKGAHGDLSETYYIGDVDEDSKRVTIAAYKALMNAIDHCKPGLMYRDVGYHIQNIADKYNCSIVRSYCGHGIGCDFHVAPTVPHYKKNKAVGFLKPGHVFTIEPMLNLGNYQDIKWPDDWTVVTADGSRSAMFEHQLLVTETGVEILTKRLPDSPPLDFEI